MNHENRIREKLYTALLAITAALLVAFSGVLPGAGLSVSAIEHDTTLTVTGLDPGDRALFYQFVRWSDKGWCYTDAFTKSTASPPTPTGVDKAQMVSPIKAPFPKQDLSGKLPDSG